jgi:SAM-dependent methyltransferase
MAGFVLRFKQHLKSVLGRLARALAAFRDRPDSVQHYLTSAPCPQNALDIFRGDWSSKLPPPLDGAEAGTIPLFQDDRVEWALQQLGGVQGRTVLELGPLEGGHAYMLEKGGASSIVSIEANARCYLKCLVAKELLRLTRVNFLCGDFVEYLRTNETAFDVCIASGVLYHMRNPAELIALIAKRCPRLYLWTHYYDEAICTSSPQLMPLFAREGNPSEYGGFKHTLHQLNYGGARASTAFCGGSAAYTNWLSRDDILACCRHFGFVDITISHEKRDHPNGPSFAFVAKRRDA